MPQAITCTTARQNLARTMNVVCDSHDAVIITRPRGESVVMMPLSDYNALLETSYLLSTPANAHVLRKAIASIDNGEIEEHPLLDDAGQE